MAYQPLDPTSAKKCDGSGFFENAVNHSGHSSSGRMNANDREASTLEKQRMELQLLIAELKDRDRELNDMVAAHQQQLAAWERERQQALMLEKKNAKYEGEMKKRAEQIRLLIQRLKASESKHKGKNTALESTQSRMKQLENDISLTNSEFRDLKGKNESLNSSLTELSTHINKMESREQELVGLLRVKEDEKRESCDHIAMLRSKLRLLDGALQDSRRSESCLRAEVQDDRSRSKQTKGEIDILQMEVLEKTKEVLAYQKDILKLKDEIHILQKEVYLRDDEIRRKDDVIDLQKSKQDRADKELAALRAIYERQQQELTYLHVDFCDSEELLEKQEERLNNTGGFKSRKKSVSFLDGAVCASCEVPEESCGCQISAVSASRKKIQFELNCDSSAALDEALRFQETCVELEEAERGSIVLVVKSAAVLDTCDSETFEASDSAAFNSERYRRKSRNFAKIRVQECLPDCEDCASDTTNDLLDEARRSAVPSNAVVDEYEASRHTLSHSAPTSKLQMLLAESREMVHNLERAASTTPHPQPNSARNVNA